MDRVKIVLIGNSCVGKTAIFTRIDIGTFTDDYISTVGGSFTKIEETNRDKKVELGFWDTAGQEKFRNVVPMYFQRAGFILVVFDITDKKSFDDIDIWISMAKERAPTDAKIIVVGNKSDLSDKRVISHDEGVKKASEASALAYVETSAKTGDGIEFLTRSIIDNIDSTVTNQANQALSSPFQQQQQPTKSSCC